MGDYSVVEIFDGPIEGHRCGYCKSQEGSLSYGMWAHSLTVEAYQDLLDRGWRRSGKYCYKPMMKETCCPLYTIKCAVTSDFKLTKSQKKVLRRMHRFLSVGDVKQDNRSSSSVDGSDDCEPCNTIDSVVAQAKYHMIDHSDDKRIAHKTNAATAGGAQHSNITCKPDTAGNLKRETLSDGMGQSQRPNVSSVEDNHLPPSATPTEASKQLKQGMGADPSKPPCKKAKLLRMKRRLEKLAKDCDQSSCASEVKTNSTSSNVKHGNTEKCLQDYLSEPMPENPAHRLEIKTVRSEPRSAAFRNTFDETYALYKIYQMTIHNDPPERCSSSQYTRFLVDSPLEAVGSEGSHPGYGSFHQQYWLDGKLIAVGVIDILPYCISSVYFYYDPKYNFLSLGTYGALREIAFTQNLHRLDHQLKYYYMGFYIHSCPKMRYKGQYMSSYLLCPEAYTWHPLGKVQPKLAISEYCRFEENPEIQDVDGEVDLDDIMVLYRRTALPYLVYLSLKRTQGDTEHQEVLRYGRLVGKKCAQRILLYRK